MQNTVSGAVIKTLRKKQKLTQSALADKLGVTDKAVSKWENDKSCPDVSLLQPLASIFGVSVAELVDGRPVTNTNCSGNTAKASFYVCPVCQNVVWSLGKAHVSCHGVTLEPLTAQNANATHSAQISVVEDEYYVTFDHPQQKSHYLGFIAAVYYDKICVQKLYAEQNAEARFKIAGLKNLYVYCNEHGVFKVK